MFSPKSLISAALSLTALIVSAQPALATTQWDAPANSDIDEAYLTVDHVEFETLSSPTHPSMPSAPPRTPSRASTSRSTGRSAPCSSRRTVHAPSSCAATAKWTTCTESRADQALASALAL